MAAVLGGGALAAYAAAPSAPAPAQALPADLDRLAKEAAGVVGSGDRLGLKIRPANGQAARTLKIGDEYRNGWKLESVTPTAATLSKAGETRKVGLNPAGAVAARPAYVPLSSVEVELSAQEQAELAALIASGRWDGNALPGLSLAESQRHMLLDSRIQAIGRAGVASPTPMGRYYPSELSQRAMFGDAAIDRLAAENATIRQATIDLQKADVAAHPITGPASYYVQAGGDRGQAMAQAGIDPRGAWLGSEPDAAGGTTYTRLGDTNEALPLVAAAENAQLAAIQARMKANR